MSRSLCFSILTALAVLSCSGVAAQSVQLEDAFPSLGAFELPVGLVHAGDGQGLLFVVEQEGVIRVFPNDAGFSGEAAVFLDIRGRVGRAGNEQGLLGLAFHPDYASNGYFFVNYTAGSNPNACSPATDNCVTVISRFTAADRSGYAPTADPASEVVILTVRQPYANHNAGHLAFGPADGPTGRRYLYFALGDGGSGGDPQDNGQDPTTLLGSLGRIDVDATQGDLNYAIPADNPFAGDTQGRREEIWAYGLRNPWRFSFDFPTGDLWLADVGQNAWEEVDLIQRGGNYGWNTMEGNHCYPAGSSCDRAGLALPVFEYDHAQGSSITGGYVYRGAAVPALAGRYVFGDFGSGRVFSLDAASRSGAEVLIPNSGHLISTFGTDAEGELYLADWATGRLYRFAQETSGGGTPPDAASYGLALRGPNPTSSATALALTAPESARARVTLHDAAGRRVAVLADAPVTRDVAFRIGVDTRRLAAGVYGVRADVGGDSYFERITVLR